MIRSVDIFESFDYEMPFGHLLKVVYKDQIDGRSPARSYQWNSLGDEFFADRDAETGGNG